MRSALLFPLILAVPAALAAPACAQGGVVAVAPDDPALQYTGRWDFSDPLRPWCAWQGSTLTFNFDGEDAAVRLDVGSSTEWWRIVVDGDHAGSRKVAVAPGPRWVVLAQGLTPGPHRIDLVKETYVGTNNRILGLRLRGTGMLPPPARPPHRIEFYGDSNLAGVSNESERDPGGNELVGVHLGFAGILARRLDAEYHNISTSGENLSGVLARYDRMQWYGENPNWDFQRFRADVVVVNIGANDIYLPWRTEAVMRADYVQLLDELRVVHPNAQIVLANARGWDFREPANFTEDVVAQYGDPKVTACIFPWVFEVFHGCQTDQAGMADVLAEHIAGLTGWSVAPSDVVVGYGRDGDVANGGFEGIAPFGGFAWRYADDPKVRRRINPAQAHEGEAYLRLVDGGAVHQPTPAGDGDLVQVSVWMRGQGSAEITIDFRDQQLYSAPMAAESATVTLGPQWQEFRFQSRAPATPRPVFHTRLTLAASAGSMVEVDQVRQRLR